MTKKPLLMPQKYLVLDIETTTDKSKIRLLGLHGATGKEYIYDDYDHMRSILKTVIAQGYTLFTWNGSRFDLPVIEHILGVEIPNERHIDGMLLMKMLENGSVHKFGLESAAKYYANKTIWKPPHPSWYNTAPIQELKEYLCDDLAATYEVSVKMLNDSRVKDKPNVWGRALKLEQRVARLVEDACKYGVTLDTGLADHTVNKLDEEMAKIEADWSLVAPMWPLPKSKVHNPPLVQFKKDGTPSSNLRKYADKYGWTVYQQHDGKWAVTDGRGRSKPLPLTEAFITQEKLTLSSQENIKLWLQNTMGWEPTYWNVKNGVKTSPRFTEKSTGAECPDLERVAQLAPSIGLITRWLMLRSRRNVICSPKDTGWIPSYHKQGKLLPDADTLGANTARFTHKQIANVPRVKSEYGKEMRSMLRASFPKVWVGWDATALEAVCEAHWCYDYDPDYSDELLNGDIHTKNFNKYAPIRDRDHAKTFKYGLTYGAQPKRLASILGCDVNTAQVIYDEFWDDSVALRRLKEDLIHQYRAKGSITTIDGREIYCRSEHSLVNALFQSTGAIIMKYAAVMADQYIKSGLSDQDQAIGLIKYHDEEIWETDPSIADHVLKVGLASIPAAAKNLGLKVPLKAEGKIGYNWAEVH